MENYITAFGRVTGVTQINGQTILLTGKVGIPMEKILSVTAPQTSAN